MHVITAMVCLAHAAALCAFGEGFWAVYFDEPIEVDDGHRFLGGALGMALAAYGSAVAAPRARMVQAAVWAGAVVFLTVNAYMVRAAFLWLHMFTAVGVLLCNWQ